MVKRVRTTDSVAMNQVGKPDAGNPHVRFDERSKETELQPPRLTSTLLKCKHSSLSISHSVPGSVINEIFHLLRTIYIVG